MNEPLEALVNMEYPGRFIILGKSLNGQNVVVYGISGRSEPSRARRLEYDAKERQVWVRPTDPEAVKKGNPDLLIYPAMHVNENGVVVSNGQQTKHLAEYLGRGDAPTQVIIKAHDWYTFEPDEPNFTPRIGGAIRSGEFAAFGIIHRCEITGGPLRFSYQIPLKEGGGKLIATYSGINVNPLPSFIGSPRDVLLPWTSAQETAQEVYNSLAVKSQKTDNDFRVAVAALHYTLPIVSQPVIINRQDF